MRLGLLGYWAAGLLAASPITGATFIQENTPYNGKFVFARLKHTERMSRFGGRGGFRGGYCDGPPWQHDYPCAERSLMAILTNATSLKPGAQAGNAIDVGDPELHKYPIAYLSHPDQWLMDEKETNNVREYLLKGGFIIFDDFPRNQGGGWGSFAQQMERLLPGLQPIVLDASHPIFHSFFEFDSLDNLFRTSYGEVPVFLGYFKDNDPKGQMYAIVNFMNDLGENWEYSDRGFNIIPEAANEAFKFGVNYILYGLTH